jgi:hypothetical protein
MKVKAQYDGKEIEVELDLQANLLVPAGRITEESGKRLAAEAQLQALQKEVGTLKGSLDLSSTRLRLAGDAAPSESAAKMARGAYQGFVDGMEKPPTFEEWSAGDGKSFLASLRPVAAAPAPAGAPNPAPAPVGAAPAPSPAAPNIPDTNKGALPASPGTRPTPAQVQAAQASLLAERRAAVGRGDTKAAEELRVKIDGLYATAGAATT